MPPPPLPSYLPPPLTFQQQQQRDAESMDLLAVFHFIYGGIGLVGTFLMAIVMLAMAGIFSGVVQELQKDGNLPQGLLVLHYSYLVVILAVALVLAAYSVSSIACGVYLKQRRHRMFIMIMSGLHCISFPIGTALGVCTLVVLQRESARTLYVD